jgi:hypothetical protein
MNIMKLFPGCQEQKREGSRIQGFKGASEMNISNSLGAWPMPFLEKQALHMLSFDRFKKSRRFGADNENHEGRG